MEEQLSLFANLKSTFKVNQVIKRNGQIAAFNPDKITNAIYKAALSVGGDNRAQAQELTLRVIQMMNATFPAGGTPSVEEIQDLIEKVLIVNGHAKTAKAFILFRSERARVREKKDTIVQAEDNIPYKLIWKSYLWNADHACESVKKLNRSLMSSRWKKLVIDSETKYHDEIKKVAELIIKRKDSIRFLIVAGPSSSGKTTATLKIGECLKAKNLSFVTLNLDHYFKNLDQHPKDEYGDYDFETPHALELGMINEHLHALSKGKKIMMPQYNFKTGLRQDHAREFQIQAGEIILIDSLHGLFSEMTQGIPQEQIFKFYIEAMCQIKDARGDFVRWTDLRMLRRMIRDSWHRSYSPDETIGHWHYVRRAEKKYIVPFIHAVDYVFNSSFGYELPVYKNLLSKYFPLVLKKYECDPKKTDAFIRAQRVSDLLDSLKEFPDLKFIPNNSPLREFIGGSIYAY